MNQGRMTFSQIMDFASQDIFKVCVKRYNGNYKAKEFSCWKQFLCLAFGQLIMIWIVLGQRTIARQR
jgi:hypothetical protein